MQSLAFMDQIQASAKSSPDELWVAQLPLQSPVQARIGCQSRTKPAPRYIDSYHKTTMVCHEAAHGLLRWYNIENIHAHLGRVKFSIRQYQILLTEASKCQSKSDQSKQFEVLNKRVACDSERICVSLDCLLIYFPSSEALGTLPSHPLKLIG